MAYVILQKGLEAPSVEKMKTAFRGLSGLTPTDAAMMCRHSMGILVRGVEQDEARQIQGSLAAQGIETEVVEQSALPALPPMRHLTRVECTPDALMIFDPVGKSFPLAWRDIMLIAAGNVGVIDFKRTSTPAVLRVDQGALGMIDQTFFKNSGWPQISGPRAAFADPNYETREVHHQRWMAEVVIRGGGLRYNLEADHASQPLFFCLGERRTDDVGRNFQLLVQDICQRAPDVAVNRGAYYLREGNTEAFAYPAKSLFYDEMIWLLWRLKTQG